MVDYGLSFSDDLLQQALTLSRILSVSPILAHFLLRLRSYFLRHTFPYTILCKTSVPILYFLQSKLRRVAVKGLHDVVVTILSSFLQAFASAFHKPLNVCIVIFYICHVPPCPSTFKYAIPLLFVWCLPPSGEVIPGRSKLASAYWISLLICIWEQE